MVTKSTKDYTQWKKDVKKHYLKQFPTKEKHINKFIDFISSRYDDVGRSFFPYKLMWFLYFRRKKVFKNQHFWVAFIGKRGGEGKSTLGKQTLHFMDNTFHPDKRIALTYEDFIKIVYITKKKEQIKNPAILLDETDPETHHLSKEGRKLRKIITKIRQFNLFIGVCANSLTDIPKFIYHRLSTIIYLNSKHRFWLWDNQYDKPAYKIVEDIKDEWKKHGHGVFKDGKILKRAKLYNQSFSKKLPFDESDYLKKKNKDLLDDIEGYLGINKESKGKRKTVATKNSTEVAVKMLHKKNPDLTDGEIAKTLNLSREWVNKLRNRGTGV